MVSGRPRHGRRLARDARGFTLLELLLAMALGATLLAGLWSLFSIYTKLFETGQAKVERSQLARALLEQLAEDLQSAIQDPIVEAPTEARTSTPLRRFVLDGSSRRLRLDILQVTPLEGNPTPVGDSERAFREPSAPRVPELRTVYYTFQGPLVSPDANPEDLPGLVRRELDFETPYADPDSSGLEGQSAGLGTSAGELPDDDEAGEPSSPESFTPDRVDDSIMWVPEVVRLEFRYFDGSGWTSQWNSLARQALPVAVEVALEMGTADQREEEDESIKTGDDLDGQPAPEARGPTYRLVVDLPGSPKHPAPKRVRPIAVRPPPPAPAPITRRIIPRRLPTRPEPAVRPLADEWMRTQP